MKKRGDFTDHALSIIIAIVVLAVIVIAAGRLYVINRNQESENARVTLDSLIARIDALDEGVSVNITVQGFRGASKWYFIGWNLNDSRRPAQCLTSSCICLCNGATSESCQENGFCRHLTKPVSVNTQYNVGLLYANSRSAPLLPSSGDSVRASGENVVFSCIPLVNNLIDVGVSNGESISVFAYANTTGVFYPGDTCGSYLG